MKRCWIVLAIALTGINLSGCTEPTELRVPVSGVVLIDGHPLTSGSIRLFPTSGRPVSSDIQSDGSFRLGEHSVAEDRKSLDVLPGHYRVAVSAAEVIDADQEEVRWLAPSRYADFRSSGIEVEVAEAEDDLLINLTWEGSDELVDSQEPDTAEDRSEATVAEAQDSQATVDPLGRKEATE